MRIFAPAATDAGRFEDYARKRYPQYTRLNVPTWRRCQRRGCENGGGWGIANGCDYLSGNRNKLESSLR
jgi:hypothetical protein